MTNNPLNFMENNFTKWFNYNSEGETLDRVIVVPCDPKENEYYSLVSEGVNFFRNCEWGENIHKDDYYIIQFTSNETEYFTYWCKGFEYSQPIEQDVGLTNEKIHFLANLVFYTTFNIKPNGQIHQLVIDGNIFEEELIQTLPVLLTLGVKKEHRNEKLEVKILRVLLYAELLDKKHTEIYEKIIELALSLPENNHDWLYYELIRAVRSKKNDSMFLCLYKMLEFFFPLKNIFNLSGQIDFSGSHLKLLEICRNELNWNVNHNYGLRGAKEYASHSFCSYLDMDMSSIESITDDDTKNKKIESFKSAGLEKLSELRHSLIHQNFRDFEFDEEKIPKYISSILVFLTESFNEYNSRIN